MRTSARERDARHGWTSAILAALICLSIPALIGAADGRVPIYQTTTITQSGSYVLTQDISVTSGPAISISAHHVTLDLDGHTITCSSGLGTVIDSTGWTDLRVTNGRIVGGDRGINFSDPGGFFQVDSVTLVNQSEIGIYVEGDSTVSARAVVRSNRLQASPAIYDGIFFQYVQGGIVDGNTLQGCEVRLQTCTNCTVANNTVSGSPLHGIILSATCAGVNIRYNTLTGNTSGNGILLYYSTGCSVSWNLASGNQQGILFGAGATNNVYAFNRTTGNSVAGLNPGTGNFDGGGNY